MPLKEKDLVDLVNPVFEIDSYKSKMGEDKNIVVLSFTVNEKAAADDLVQFIESGYNFVLDATATSGEQSDGYYRVFVEMEREDTVPNQIMELMDGVQKLTDQNFSYRYYKSFDANELTAESLAGTIPLDVESYEKVVNEENANNLHNFFSRSYLEESFYNNDVAVLKKPYADPVALKIVEFGDKQQVLENLKEKINVNDYAEILFLTKYLGDYNITKYGSNTLTLENKGHMLVVQR